MAHLIKDFIISWSGECGVSTVEKNSNYVSQTYTFAKNKKGYIVFYLILLNYLVRVHYAYTLDCSQSVSHFTRSIYGLNGFN